MFRYIFLAIIFMMVSCSAHHEINVDITPVEINVSVDGFDITSSSMTRAGESSIPENLNRCALTVFNTNGEVVTTISQKLGESSFGTATLTLEPGDYTFVCILNDSKSTGAAAATITSPTSATIPGFMAHDTYCCSQSVTITSNTTDVTLDMGTRCNSRFKLIITDAVPAGVSKIRLTIMPDGTESGASIAINPSTGLTPSPLMFYGNKPLTTTTVPEIQMDVLLPENPYSTSVVIEGRNADDEVLYSRTIDNVEFAPNKMITATGCLFGTSTSFSFSTTDWSEVNITF